MRLLPLVGWPQWEQGSSSGSEADGSRGTAEELQHRERVREVRKNTELFHTVFDRLRKEKGFTRPMAKEALLLNCGEGCSHSSSSSSSSSLSSASSSSSSFGGGGGGGDGGGGGGNVPLLDNLTSEASKRFFYPIPEDTEFWLVADAIVFGALSPCPRCGNRTLLGTPSGWVSCKGECYSCMDRCDAAIHIARMRYLCLYSYLLCEQGGSTETLAHCARFKRRNGKV